MLHITEEFGFVEYLRKIVDGCWEGAFFGCVWVGIAVDIPVEEPLGCLGDFGPVDGEVGRRGGYKVEKAR